MTTIKEAARVAQMRNTFFARRAVPAKQVQPKAVPGAADNQRLTRDEIKTLFASNFARFSRR